MTHKNPHPVRKSAAVLDTELDAAKQSFANDVRKAQPFAGYIAITKIDNEQQIVAGCASAPVLDSQDEIVTTDAMRNALPDYMKFANIREMHGAIAAGVTLKAWVDDAGDTQLVTHIVDPLAWLKVKTGVYKGFSIGGRVPADGYEIVKRDDGTTIRKITKLQVSEISLVDRPACPEALITMWKVDMANEQEGSSVAANTLEETAKAAGDPNSDKAVKDLLALHNAFVQAGNADAAAQITSAIGLVQAATGTATDDGADGEDDETDDSMSEDDAADLPAPGQAAETPDQVAQVKAAKAPVRKVGAAISTGNKAHLEGALHGIAKVVGVACNKCGTGTGTLKMQAPKTSQPVHDDDGDDMTAADNSADVLKSSSAYATDVAAALSPALNAIAQALAPIAQGNADVQKAVSAITARVEHIEKQPVSGGPAVRAVAVAAAERPAPGTGVASIAAADPEQAELDVLTKMISETNDDRLVEVLKEKRGLIKTKIAMRQPMALQFKARN